MEQVLPQMVGATSLPQVLANNYHMHQRRSRQAHKNAFQSELRQSKTDIHSEISSTLSTCLLPPPIHRRLKNIFSTTTVCRR
jgi:hypothetical protein